MERNKRRRDRIRESAGKSKRPVVNYRENMSAYKAAKRLDRAMADGKPPIIGRFRLHDAHVRQYAERVERAAHVMSMAMARAMNEPHDAHVRCWRKQRPGAAYNHRYRNDPEFNAKQRTRARMRKLATVDGQMAAYLSNAIKKSPMWKAWEDLLGYDSSQLVRHLKRTMPKGAKWDDFMAGRLHIDHIIPRSRFDLTIPAEVRKCWCLSNLRLLWAADNIRKRDRVEFLL
jgi:hypothetical protein